ncbi:MAG: RHS repeat-associated core domain-containing protein [Balneolaceae bacterium]
MKRFLKILPLLFLLSTTLFIEQLQACGLNPTARIVTTPNTLTIYSGDQLQFSGTTSTPGCGSINQYRWQVDGVTKSWSSSYAHTFTLAAGVVEQVFTVQLRVRNTYNKYGYKTIYITVRDNQSLYYITDHLGSVRVTVDEDGEAVTWDDYYPYGKRMAQRTQNIGDDNDDTKYTGYQYEDEGDLNLYHAGARLYDPEIGRFLSRDRFDAKYPSFTPYQYAANNPISFIDVNGDSIWIEQGRNRFLYVDGKLFNEDGSEYEGRKRGFLGDTFRALNKIRLGGYSGKELISQLQNSTDNHTIKKSGRNYAFRDFANQSTLIEWNPSDRSGGLNEKGRTGRPSFIGLAHELGHAATTSSDSRMYSLAGAWYTSPTNGKVIKRFEMFGVHWENKIRVEHNLPLRTNYEATDNSDSRTIIPGTQHSVHMKQDRFFAYRYGLQKWGNILDLEYNRLRNL